MSTNPDEMTMASLLARVSELEQEMAALRAARETNSAQEVSQPGLGAVKAAGDAPAAGPARRKRSSRRGLLRTAVVAATAVVGAGALLDRSVGVAHANGSETPTTFTSTTSGTPAVTANGTNGAFGIYGSSDSGQGISGFSSSYIGVVGETSSNYFGVYGKSFSSAGSGVAGESDVSGTAGIGVQGYSTTGSGVYCYSTTGYGMHAIGGGASASSGPGAAGAFVEGGPNYGVFATATGNVPAVEATNSSGPALVANGHVQVQGNSVGTATLLAGKTSVTVTTPAATTSSNVLLTPQQKHTALWVTLAAGSFTIHATSAPSTNVTIGYLIIN